jgi:hypothetical protein
MLPMPKPATDAIPPPITSRDKEEQYEDHRELFSEGSEFADIRNKGLLSAQ